MKHHVLLGLILGLLATAKLGGQVLFNVEANLTAGTITITPTENLPRNLPIGATEFTTTQGITLLNFFPATANVPQPSGGAALGTNGVLSTGALRVFGNPGASVNVELTHFQVYSPGTFSGSNQGAGTPPEAFPSNPGKSLNLFNDTNGDLTLGGGETESTFKFFSLSTNTLTISFSTPLTTTSGSFLSGGPYYVYSGQNTASVQGFATEGVNTFLGTYEITVVPEPSTYAAIAGGLGLLAAVLHRRRQRARATAA